MRRSAAIVFLAIMLAATPAAAESQHPQRDARLSTTMVAGFVVAGIGITLGAVTGSLSFAKTSELSDACDGDVCPIDQEDTLDEAQLLSNLSNAGFLVGGIGVAVGMTALVAMGENDDVAWSVAPVIGGGLAGARATLRF